MSVQTPAQVFVGTLRRCPGLPGKPPCGVVTPRALCFWCQRTLDGQSS